MGELPNGVYDQQTYRATLSVYRDNGTLTALVVLYQGDSSDKLHTATFRNVYAALPTPEPTATLTPRPTPRPTDGSLTPTGVEDHWPLYLAGMAVLAVIACAMIVVLCRKERHDEPQKR